MPSVSDPRRFLALVFPFLAADLFRLIERQARLETRSGKSPSDAPSGSPLAFIVKQRGAFRLHALDEAAPGLGLEPGMALADARARVPDLRAVPHDPAGEAHAMERLADLCDRFTPMVAVAPPDGLLLDLSGCTHLFGGEAALDRDAVRLMQAQGLRVRSARAATPEAALALAQLGSGTGGDEKAAIHRLPLLALRPVPDALLALRRAGFATLGDLAALPPRPLAARFGAGLVDMLAAARPHRQPHHAAPLSPAGPRRAPLRRAGRAHRDGHGRAGRIAGAGLRDAGRAPSGRAPLRHAALSQRRGDARSGGRGPGSRVRDPGVVLRLFEERIEALADPLDPGFGFDIVRLAVPAMEALDGVQHALDGDRAQSADLAALLDRLAVRAGGHRFRRLAPRDTHMPERVTRLVPVAAPDLPDWGAPLSGEPPLRPLTLLDPPERVEVMAQVPDGPPRQFRWRGAPYRIVAQEGPERIAPEWWRHPQGHADRPGLTRDYYRVEDEGGHRFWLFRHGLYERETDRPDWYVHGLFA